jgi:glycosyltransferase involved in cell wall biosynthesis
MPASAPSVSVIIPTYNRASLVDRCLTSLHASGIDDLEVLVVDDGGTDDTERVVGERGVYLRQENAGPAKARNLGFEKSRGRFVGFIDSDDEWINRAAPRLRDGLDAHPDIDVLFADSLMGNDADGYVSFVEEYGDGVFLSLPHTLRDGHIRVFQREPFFRQLSTRNVMFLGSMLIRREFFDRVGRFDPALRGAADWDFFMRAAASGTVAFSHGPAMSRYYKHDEGMSTNQDHMLEEFILALDSVRRRAPLTTALRAHVDARIRAQVFGWAWRAYEAGDMAAARRRLRWAGQLGASGAREKAYLASTYLPPILRNSIRRARQRVSAGA